MTKVKTLLIVATFLAVLTSCDDETQVDQVAQAPLAEPAVLTAQQPTPQVTTTTTAPPVATTTPKPTAPKAQPVEEPTVTIEPPEVAYGGDVEQLICSYFPNNCGNAIAVARCESGLNPSASSGRGDEGLWQIRPSYHSQMIRDWAVVYGLPANNNAVYDPRVATAIAVSLSKGGTDFSTHWTCARKLGIA